MGGCFSSSSPRSEDPVEPARGGYRPQQRRVRPSDEDGEWPLASRRTVDREAEMYIAKFHQYQSNCCAEHSAMAPLTPAPAS